MGNNNCWCKNEGEESKRDIEKPESVSKRSAGRKSTKKGKHSSTYPLILFSDRYKEGDELWQH